MWLLTLLLMACPADTLDERTDDLHAAIDAYARPLGLAWDPGSIRIAWTDLNGDRRDDALVYLTGSAWCGSGGCTVLVFEAMDDLDAEEFGPYRPAAEIGLVHTPIRVVRTRQIWCDLIAADEGGTFRRLSFNGDTYPPSPGSAPAIRGPLPLGEIVFAD